MLGRCGLGDWLLGAALGWATILLILGRIFSGFDLLRHFWQEWWKNRPQLRCRSVTAPPGNSAGAPAHRVAYTPTVIPRKQRLAAPRANLLGDSGRDLPSWLPAAISSIGCSGTNRIASCRGDFQNRCHSWAALQAACINGSFDGALSSSGG
jgi:hypothetical protein